MASVPLSDVYVHIRIVISMIVGLCITALLAGFARFVQHPRREHISLLHLGWAASMLIWVIHFWWWEFRLSAVEHWTFGLYLFIILYATLYYLICKLLFPDDIKGYSGYEEYFLSRRRWFFSLLAVSFIADYVDTALKGSAYLHSFGIEYPLRLAIYLFLCGVAIFVVNRRFQFTLLAASLIYQISFILRHYRTQ